MFVATSTQLSVALLFALFCATSALPSLNMTNICLLVGNGYKIASQDSCSNYYYCNGGVAVEETCGKSLYFSKDLQTCAQQSQVNCFADGSAPCAGREIGTWAPMQNSCSGFYYCSANGPLASSCPNGEIFDPVSQSCQYADVYGCTSTGSGGDSADDSINLCSFIQNGVYFGSASNCANWNICKNNIMSTGTCNNKLVFNVNLRTCDYSSDWSCSQVTNDPNLVNTPINNGGNCTTNGDTKASTQCDSYYLCNGQTYVLYKCAVGNYYDTVSKTCVDRMQARNDCDRCEDSTKSFVNAYGTNCTGYLYCENGVKKTSGTCQNGYFDEVAGACVIGEDQPDYACCNFGNAGATTSSPQSTSEASSEASTGATEAPTEASTTAE